MAKKEPSWRKIHIRGEEWRYRVHRTFVEIRDPRHKKYLALHEDVLPFAEFEGRFEKIDEEYDNEGYLYPVYYDKQEDCRVEFETGRFDNLKVYFFAVTPERVKNWIVKNLSSEKPFPKRVHME